MTAVRLEAEVHIVTAAVTSAQNIVRSVEKAELFVEDIVLQPLASSEAVLSQDERSWSCNGGYWWRNNRHSYFC